MKVDLKAGIWLQVESLSANPKKHLDTMGVGQGKEVSYKAC